MTLNPGDILNTRYRIEEIIDRGAFGTVYRAFDQSLESEVSIKEFNAQTAARFGDPADMQKRFEQEARIARQLAHPHIIQIDDLFRANNTGYIVMPYMPDTLANRLSDQDYFSLLEAIRVMNQVCAGMAYAHTFEGDNHNLFAIVHCDIKPGNILFDKLNQVKITDFGIAHVPQDSPLTNPNFAAGTLFYMSPEQLDGKRDDPRIDVYALGALFYTMLTGRHYLDFEPQNNEAAPYSNRVLIRTTSPLVGPLHEKDVPEPVIEIILKALSKTPSDRYPNANEMLAAIDGAANQLKIHEHPGSLFSKNLLLTGVALSVGLILLGLVGLASSFSSLLTPTLTGSPSATATPPSTLTSFPTPTSSLLISTPPPPLQIVLGMIDTSGTERLNVRSGPSVTYPVVARLENASQVTVSRRTPANDWLEITAPQQQQGWAFAKYIRITGSLEGLPTVTPLPPTPGSSGLILFDLTAPGTLGLVSPNQEQWYAFQPENREAVIVLMFMPDVNFDSDRVQFFLYHTQQVPGWPPPENPDNLPHVGLGSHLAFNLDPDPNTGELVWRGPLERGVRYYLRLVNNSPETIQYCLTLRDVNAWVCQQP